MSVLARLRSDVRTVRVERLAIGIGIGAIIGCVIRNLPPRVYTTDFQQDWLTASALQNGLDPLASIDTLASVYLPQAGIFPHPSPHPPALLLMALPFAALPYEVASLIWLGIGVLIVYVTGRQLGLGWPGSLAIMAWPPLFATLAIGQWEAAILALAVLGWREADRGRDARAGLLLGLAASIKLYPALILVPYLLRRRLRLIAAAAAVFLASQVLGLLVVGPGGMVRYWTEVLPAVNAIYRHTPINISPFGVLSLFGMPGYAAFGVIVLAALALLVRAEPKAWGAAPMLMLPTAWAFYAAIALPYLLSVWQKGRLSTLLAFLASSPAMLAVGLAAHLGPPYSWWLMGLLGVVQPLALLALLLLHRPGCTASVAAEPVPADLGG
jgi:alpha-1,2-mannosyltransferase